MPTDKSHMRHLLGRTSVGPVRFMGSHSGRLWWDIGSRRGGTYVVQAGFINRPQWPRIYWSPNGTPWHHDAHSVFRAAFVEREQCVCGEPDCTNPQESHCDLEMPSDQSNIPRFNDELNDLIGAVRDFERLQREKTAASTGVEWIETWRSSGCAAFEPRWPRLRSAIRSTMSEPMTDAEKAARDRKAATIAELLRLGHDPEKVANAIKIADGGGSVLDVMEALA